METGDVHEQQKIEDLLRVAQASCAENARDPRDPSRRRHLRRRNEQRHIGKGIMTEEN
ncbi:hypothetical protein PM082_014941 [Marasmius tenuissimus]|nr:hypothetical protein PM082_014941 [Marasmius tenuissimus]